jgi:hypothetical protein
MAGCIKALNRLGDLRRLASIPEESGTRMAKTMLQLDVR